MNVKMMLDGLNNAIIAYHDIISNIEFGLEPQISPSRMKPLEGLSIEELHGREEELMVLYEELLKLEKRGIVDWDLDLFRGQTAPPHTIGHGVWSQTSKEKGVFRCSACGKTSSKTHPYCPNCGRPMS